MTPMLQQALKILQLNNLELAELVDNELAENPLLEDGQEGEPAEGADLESIPDLDAAGAGLSQEEGPATEKIAEAAGTENQADKVQENADETPVDDASLSDHWEDYFGEEGQSSSKPDSDKESFESFISRPATLQEHLLSQLDARTELGEAQRRQAEEVIGDLDRRGYFTTSLEDGLGLGASPREAYEALRLVQSFTPAGVGARDLRECLLLQLEAKGEKGGLAWKLVSDHLAGLEDRRSLADRLSVLPEMLEKALALIKSLEPNPGRPFGLDEAQAVAIDATIERDEKGDYHVVLPEGAAPSLTINPYYRRMLKAAGREKSATQAYLSERYQAALWLIRSIEQRKRTLQKVLEALVEAQKAYLDDGPAALAPLTLKDIAARTSLHESTVSRVTSHKYVQTPRGVLDLRSFFSGGFKTGEAGSTSAPALKEKIRALVEAEDAWQPCSDQQLADLLKAQGIEIARRTVAKYREELRIPPVVERRKSKDQPGSSSAA
jgi:RNA polymerase sigma-54 factor